MMPEKEITFELSRNDAGQVIDGLTVCYKDWRKTLDWYEGKLEDTEFFILECNGRREAEKMVEIYQDLLESLQRQFR